MLLLEMKGAELDMDHAKYQAARRGGMDDAGY
jgi:hypothetical protein